MSTREVVLKTLNLELGFNEVWGSNRIAGIRTSGTRQTGNGPVGSGNLGLYPGYLQQTQPATSSNEYSWAYFFNIPNDYVEGTDAWFDMKIEVSVLATPSDTEDIELWIADDATGRATTNLCQDGAQAVSTGWGNYIHNISWSDVAKPGDLCMMVLVRAINNTSGGSEADSRITSLKLNYYGYR